MKKILMFFLIFVNLWQWFPFCLINPVKFPALPLDVMINVAGHANFGLLIVISLQGCAILSGDVIIRHLAQLLRPQYVVFLVSTW